ncbi:MULTISPECIES: hypothetical protein [unclassified Kitasatospora]|uniref:hypothetical protein n=1 Tax=unclassified Kitasatospora TaxID=2633591 RepID=UPI0033811F68
MTEAALLPFAVAIPLLGAALLAVAGRRLPRTGCDILATTALRRPAADRHAAARAVRALRRLRSGHLGDYLARLALGVTVLCVAIAAQT